MAGSHTFPSFSYSHFGLSTQVSRFNTTTGTLMLDREAKNGAVDVVIDTRSVESWCIFCRFGSSRAAPVSPRVTGGSASRRRTSAAGCA
ncbi:YceI family protein [Thiocapsa sp. UBA6158]|uniref:YceI family protein n=1 Tax=Thiocapsa sp. UBA6158 TaxID=1947692 RepID=UPI0039C95BFE